MSTCLSHLGIKESEMLFGTDDEDLVFDFAKTLEESHGLPKALGGDETLEEFLTHLDDKLN